MGPELFFFLYLLCFFAIFDFKAQKKGEALFFKIFEIEEELYLGKIPGVYDLIEYKFFSKVLNDLLELSRIYGLCLTSFIPNFRRHLNRDLSFEKEVSRLFMEGMGQFILVFILSWAFKYFAMEIIALPPSRNFSEIFALGMQIAGLVIYFFIFTLIKRKLFDPFKAQFAAYYKLWAYMKAGISTGEVIGLSEVLKLRPSKGPQSLLHQKILRPLKSWEEKGIPISPLIELVIEELWGIYDMEFHKFQKILRAQSFIILAIFYLGGYFVLLWGALGPFLIEMKGLPK